MSRADPQLKVRLPLEMKEKLEKEATENHRSMNAEIVARLSESLGRESKPFIPSAEYEAVEIDDDVEKVLRELNEATAKYMHLRDRQARAMDEARKGKNSTE